MVAINYDAHFKQTLKDEMFDFLYLKITDEFQDRESSIIRKNMILQGYPYYQFTYKGQMYWDFQPTAHVPGRTPLQKLHPSLHAEMDELIKERDELNNNEVLRSLGFINAVLNTSNNFQDYYSLFPECLYPVLDCMKRECPCRTEATLSTEARTKILTTHANAIEGIRKRLVTNLLT